jgi:hypothetical protein
MNMSIDIKASKGKKYHGGRLETKKRESEGTMRKNSKMQELRIIAGVWFSKSPKRTNPCRLMMQKNITIR